MASDDDHRRKSRKHDGSGRSKRRSSSDRDRRHKDEDRHSHRSRDRDSGHRKDRDGGGGGSRHSSRDGDSGRRKERDGGGGGSRDRTKSSRGEDDGGHGRVGDRKLTAEDEKLYAKAREYVKREGKDGSRRHQKDDLRGGRGGKRRRSDSGDSNSIASREGKRHRSHKRDHKRSSSNKKDRKKSKHDQHEEKIGRHKKKHSSKKKENSFHDKASVTINPANLVSLGDVVREPPAEKLDPETNYFSHNSHLRLFLYRQFGIYFENLTSTESHEAFKEFAKQYNAGKLEGAYYDASGLLPQEALDQCSRTKHQWKFRTNRVEEQGLEMIRAGVKKQTEYSDKGRAATAAANATGKREVAYPITRMRNDREDADDAQQERPRRTPQEIAAQRQGDKRYRDRIKMGNEEIHGVGKADHGWERKLEKRREQSEKLHGAARDRDSEAYGGVELDDNAIYGGGGGVTGGRKRGEPTYEEALARERKRRERKEAEKAARTRELLQKEEEKQKKMLEMIGLSGLKPGQKIKIAPRNDGA